MDKLVYGSGQVRLWIWTYLSMDMDKFGLWIWTNWSKDVN